MARPGGHTLGPANEVATLHWTMALIACLAVGQPRNETLRQRFEREMNDPVLRQKHFDFLSQRSVIESDPNPPRVPDYLRFERGWQTGEKCGPVALYFLLRLKGQNVTMDQVVKSVRLGEGGATLADLQQAATDFGLPTRAVKFTPEDMPNLPTPYIVHYNLTGDNSSKGNHFDVIYKTFGSDACNFLDTTNCVIRSGEYGLIAGRVSGYALVPEARREWWLPMLWAVFGLVLAGNIFLLSRVGLNRLRRPSHLGGQAGPDAGGGGDETDGRSEASEDVE